MTTSSSDSMNVDIINQQGVPDYEREESPIETQMTEDDVRHQSAGTEAPTTTTGRGDTAFTDELLERNQKRPEREV